MTWEIAEDGRYRYNQMGWIGSMFAGLDHNLEVIPDPPSSQFEFDFQEEGCKHKWQDDDGPKGLGFYCNKCGGFRELEVISKKHKKTYQEVYEIMQQDEHLKF